ncbi:hypothetical protein METP3_01221 [Methanosarcinales archaeon]|nr:MAG: DUF262 domain-containing protein [Candidatus Methanoperedens sp.]CAG0967243.1 hypothetical protein METP3_01221 [Methanosarcinales archaeon]
MGEYQDTHILDIVDEINHKYFLPHIQRSFVWKEDQIVRLFDSLLRGYPIGTFLFWVDKSGEIRKRKFIENYYKKYSKDFNIKKLGLEDTSQSRDVTLVLDGQQRLQSLFIAMKGKYEDKELYLNLLSGENENEDGIIYEFKFFKIPTNIDGKAIWIKVKDIVNKFNRKGVLVSDVKRELSHTMGVDVTKEGIIEKNIERLKNAFISDRRLSYYDEKEENYEKVFDIFVRVNSGGTPLSKSDLLFSFIKLKWETFEAEKEFPNLLEEINSNEQFEFDVDFVLKTSLVLMEIPVKYTVKTFTGEKGKEIAKKIESNWGTIKETITTVVDLIRDYFRIENKKLLPSNNALIPIIYYSFKKNKKSNSDFDDDDKKIIKNWLLNILLSGTFSGQSDNFLEKSRKIIDDNLSFGKFPAKEINAEFKSLKKITEVNEEILKEISYGTPQSCLLLYLIYPYGVNFKPSNNANYPQQDHIFSKNELKTYGESDINRIGNIRLVTSCANKRKLATPYNEWIKTESPDELKLTLIPDNPESWSLTNYKSFVEKREQMILEKVKEAL